jgi:chemotaxis protein methyltransferase CheR
VSPAAVSGDGLVADPLFPSLKAHLVESTGLTYYTDKDVDLAHRVRRRLSIVGAPDCASYLEILRDPLRGPSELDELIAEVTIGETYFFRHQEHFDALRDLVFPDLIARNRATRRLRIWCAGCADGPEPYSLSILLKRDMASQLAGWDVSILGTDINRRCLARAREGKFEGWALRSTPEDLKRACFRGEGRLRSLAPEYKEGVAFQYHNLAEHSFPSLVNNLFCFDLIVCRNVMIYFGAGLMQRTIRQFHDCLVPGSWLLVGPSEPNMTHFSSFRIVNAPGVTLYQKPASELVGQDGILRPIVNRPACDEATAESSPIDDRPRVDNPPHHPTLADIRRYADQGAWEIAVRACEQLLKQDNLNSKIHFYHALVLEQTGKHDEAERSLRRATYLDRQSVLAHYYLGLFLQSRGDLRRAERSFENALQLLRSRSDADIFVDADGITAAELRKLAKMHVEILRDRV